MKKTLLILIAILCAFSIACIGETIPENEKANKQPVWCFMVVNNSKTSHIDFNPSVMCENYPFVNSMEDPVVGIYQNKKKSLLLCHNNDFPNTCYANCLTILSSKYMKNKSKPFSEKYNKIMYNITKMQSFKFLKETEYNHLYDLIKKNGDKKEINKLIKLNKDRAIKYDKLSKDSDFINRSQELMQLDSIMQQSKDTYDKIIFAEYLDFMKYLSEHRIPMDAYLTNSIIAAAKRKELLLYLLDDKRPSDYDITNEVMNILDK